ncbi:hypothetical protein E2C01_004776 [Portunus trituberculatus]|uniref:Uncharacterized protein n=1 Tax=Portunus trituberculatus TaxID=210409 RepID=A0A5B7CSJ7_PORTR|nr:hypothetical protein [Portunus trituberculatus]
MAVADSPAGVGGEEVRGGRGRGGGVHVAPVSGGEAQHGVVSHFVVHVQGTLDAPHDDQAEASHKAEHRHAQQHHDEVAGLHGG